MNLKLILRILENIEATQVRESKPIIDCNTYRFTGEIPPQVGTTFKNMPKGLNDAILLPCHLSDCAYSMLKTSAFSCPLPQP